MDRSTESVPADDSSAQILAAWPTGRVVADRYEIGPVLGVGGSSVIYRAFDRTLGQPVALKVLRRDRISAAAAGRLRREVAVARNAVSPHLVRIFDIGVAESDTFLTMELVDGQSLRKRLSRGPMSIEETVTTAKQLLRGLAALHAQHMIHRDVKPSNVLADSAGAVKLADFGLAVDPSADGERPTQTGTLVGTAEYMSPEQVTGAPLDARSDLYSFGVLLYECLTGELPFGPKSSVAALLAHVRERPRNVRAVRPEVPKWLARLVSRLLAKEADQRFESAEVVLTLLDEERSPRRWQPIAAAVAAGTVATLAFAAGAELWSDAHRFDRLTATGVHGIEAVDRDGRVLWRNANTDVRHAAVVHVGGETRIAAIENANVNTSPASRSKVLLLDTDTGQTVSSVVLPSPAMYTFPQYPDAFTSMQLSAVDFDHDGNDEIIVPFVHAYWPSYTVVYDLAQRAERLIYIHSGHAPMTAFADVNGDGRDDLLVGGINNRMGWYNGLAAIDMPPVKRATTNALWLTCSPDSVHSDSDQRRLLWYELMPAEFLAMDAIHVDRKARSIAVRYSSRPDVVLTFGGYPRASTSTLDSAQREAARSSAYDTLREVARLLNAGQSADAEARSAVVMNLAAIVADPCLSEWARRVHMRTLVHLGRIEEAEREGEALVRNSSAIADSAYDLAHELHLTGHPAAAFRWYRRGLYAGRDVNAGRLRYEFVQGAVLALAEEERWREAEAFLEEARRGLPSFIEEPLYINYLRWRRGEDSFVPANTGTGDVDLSRYWSIEQRHVTGTRGARLLALISAEEPQTSFTGLLLSLKAVALEESGDHVAARRAALAAVEWSEPRAATDVAVRAHLPLVRQRARDIGAM